MSVNEDEKRMTTLMDSRQAILDRLFVKTEDGTLKWENSGGLTYTGGSRRFMYYFSLDGSYYSLRVCAGAITDPDPDRSLIEYGSDVGRRDDDDDGNEETPEQQAEGEKLHRLFVLIETLDRTYAEVLEDLK